MGKYKISVGEPWDFEGPDGKNLILGEVIKSLSPRCAIFRADHVFNFDGDSGSLFILQTRYEGEKLVHGEKYEGTIGAGLLLINDYENRSIEDLEKNSKYVIIGGLKQVE